VEEVGYVNPLTKKHSLEKDRILHWLKNGAQASPRVHNLLVSEKIVEGKKVATFNLGKKAKEKAAAAKAAAAVPASEPAPIPQVPAENPPEAPAKPPKE
jgi:ribosomal protein S16